MVSLRDAETSGGERSKSDLVGQFLNPEAMLTPGLVGALVMMITNGLAVNFGAPRAYTGLAISFICGLLVLVIDRRWWLRVVYYVVNSLIIFCIAFGANGLGAGVAGNSAVRLGLAPISAAFAASVRPAMGHAGAPEASGRSGALSRAQLEETIQRQQQQIEHFRNDSSTRSQKSFFSPWTLK